VIDVGGQNIYLMFLGMMIDVGGPSVVYWIVAMFFGHAAHHHRYKCFFENFLCLLPMFLLHVRCH